MTGDWRTRAACRAVDPRLFDPITEQERKKHDPNPAAHARVLHALAVCDTCPVVTFCAITADAHDYTGVWGGEYRTEPKTVRSTSGASLRGTGNSNARRSADLAAEARHLLEGGMSVPLVAKALGMSEGWVRTLLGRGKRAAA